MQGDEAALAAIAGIEAVPQILDAVCRLTGARFAAIGRLSDDAWVCCASLGDLDVDLKPGDRLPRAETLCSEVGRTGEGLMIGDVAGHPIFGAHEMSRRMGLQSFLSVPILRADGHCWGTLCAVDPAPPRLEACEAPLTIGLFAKMIALYLDKSEHLQHAEALLQAEQRQSSLREQFIAVLGHDLRGPLQAMATGLTAVERLPQRAPQTLQMLGRSVKRMVELVENLTDFARARLGGGMVIGARSVDSLDAFLVQVVDEARLAWPSRVIHYESVLDVPVWCDPARLAQLLANLLTNALKYGEETEPVEIYARVKEGVLSIGVVNAGAGLAAAELALLFQPYVRGSRGRGADGLGLGLFIVAEIARAHGGAMEVQSANAQTRFTLRMPAAAAGAG